MASIEPVSQANNMQYTSPAARAETASTSTSNNQSDTSGGTPQYLIPVIQIDPNTGIAVTKIRNTETGNDIAQYPAKRVVEEYSRHLQAEKTEHEASKSSNPTASVSSNSAVSAQTSVNVVAASSSSASTDDGKGSKK